VFQRSTLTGGLPATDYYAPNFKLEVDDKEISPGSKGDVVDLRITMDKENLTSFLLTVNNWDDEHFTFKYSDGDSFDLGRRVHIHLGYADKLTSVMRGIINSLTPRFAEGGPPTLAVGGLDSMWLLRDHKPTDQHTVKFTDVEDGEIAERIARRHQLKADADKGTGKHPLVIQKNQDDAVFLMERAKRIDFDCFVQNDPKTGRDTLYFKRPSDRRDGKKTRTFVFEWGKNLISFSPTLDLSRQVGKVTVKGWSPLTKERISYTASASDLPRPGGGQVGANGPAQAESKFAKHDVVVDQPVMSKQEARDLAISRLRERAYQYLTGSARAIGMAELRPGDNVEVKNVGRRFDGVYYVTKVEHQLGSNGYFMEFEVRRDAERGKTAAKP
jgi:phage protein D